MRDFSFLWDTELSYRYPDFIFEDKFDTEFGLHIYLRDDLKRVLSENMHRSEFVSRFPRFFRFSHDKSHLLSGVMVYFEMFDDIGPIAVSIMDDNGGPFELNYQTKEEYRVNANGEIPVTSDSCVEILHNVGGYFVLLGVLDGLQNDAEALKKYLKEAE